MVWVEARPDLVPEDSPSQRLRLTHVTTLWSDWSDRAGTVPATSHRLKGNPDFQSFFVEFPRFFGKTKIGAFFKKIGPDGEDLGRMSCCV